MMYRGAFGKVLLGVCSSTGAKVAIKVPKGTSDEHADYLDEVAALELVHDHFNVVSLHEMIETDCSVYIVMQYAEGGSLLDHLKRKSVSVSEMDVKFIVFQVLRGLEVSGCNSSSA